MKKITILLLLVLPAVSIAQNDELSWDYPVKPGTDIWKEFNTAEEMNNALMIPKNIINAIPTEKLVDICLNYPSFMSMLAYQDLQTGFNIIVKNFNGLQELIKRMDAGQVLLNKYNSIDPNDLIFSWKDQINTVYVYLYLELLLSQKEILSKLDKTERLILLSSAKNHLEKKNGIPKKYSLFLKQTSYLVMSRILEFENTPVYSNESDSTLAKELIIFNKYVILSDLRVLDQIVRETDDYLLKNL